MAAIVVFLSGVNRSAARRVPSLQMVISSFNVCDHNQLNAHIAGCGAGGHVRVWEKGVKGERMAATKNVHKVEDDALPAIDYCYEGGLGPMDYPWSHPSVVESTRCLPWRGVRPRRDCKSSRHGD
ncbi:MAG: hypothetical protein Ct9H300mP8_09880 [Gammaproteobacteria bacterium]|nr:MAG: hypothetical protein Ct9H300mP8_09880 [Gammaproteobacteria bacterium]